MKRAIKFRAWNIPNKLMYFDIQKGILTEKNGMIQIGASLDTLCKDAGSEVMQYTGLKDKNGKEIYEGDIFRLCGKQKRFIRFIAFAKGSFMLENYKGILYNIQDIHNHEIIGNIYENADLLN